MKTCAGWWTWRAWAGAAMSERLTFQQAEADKLRKEFEEEAFAVKALAEEMADGLAWVLGAPSECQRCVRAGGPCVGHAALAKWEAHNHG